MSGSKLNLLIVDDERFNLAILELIFDGSEFSVTTARDGMDAIEKLKQMSTCDAILLDWMMPNMDGLQLLKVLKADLGYCKIPVIMQSAVGSDERVKEAMGAGAHAYLVKPYEEDIILSSVRTALADAQA